MTASVVKGSGDASHLERTAGDAVAPEGEEQGQAGDRRRQHDGQVDECLGERLAAEAGAGQHEGQGRAQDDDHDQADGGAREAEHEGIEHGPSGERVHERARVERAQQERHHRQGQEGQPRRPETTTHQLGRCDHERGAGRRRTAAGLLTGRPRSRRPRRTALAVGAAQPVHEAAAATARSLTCTAA